MEINTSALFDLTDLPPMINLYSDTVFGGGGAFEPETFAKTKLFQIENFRCVNEFRI
jgi:hypothetical protein